MILSDEEIQANLPSGWAGDSSGIAREYRFGSYEEGVAFAVHVALLAQKNDHHPDELMIGWKRVRVVFVTHSAGGVTRKDLTAAGQVNDVAGS